MKESQETLPKATSCSETCIIDHLGNPTKVRWVSYEGKIWFAVVDIVVAAGAGVSNVTYVAGKASDADVIALPYGRRKPTKYVNLSGLREIVKRSLRPAMGLIHEQLTSFSNSIGAAQAETTSVTLTQAPTKNSEMNAKDEAVIAEAVRVVSRRIKARQQEIEQHQRLMEFLQQIS